MNGVERIAAERKRQIEVEGFDAAHDVNEYGLAWAAICYALPDRYRGSSRRYDKDDGSLLPLLDAFWPWDHKWWKPSPDNRIRELEKAGALIAAEIDRILEVERLLRMDKVKQNATQQWETVEGTAGRWYQCPECGRLEAEWGLAEPTSVNDTHNYCPNCGTNLLAPDEG